MKRNTDLTTPSLKEVQESKELTAKALLFKHQK